MHDFEPDPADGYFDKLLTARAKLMLIVTSFPGQPSQVVPAPPHLRAHFKAGLGFPPFIREATPEELSAYLDDNLDWGSLL